MQAERSNRQPARCYTGLQKAQSPNMRESPGGGGGVQLHLDLQEAQPGQKVAQEAGLLGEGLPCHPHDALQPSHPCLPWGQLHPAGTLPRGHCARAIFTSYPLGMNAPQCCSCV